MPDQSSPKTNDIAGIVTAIRLAYNRRGSNSNMVTSGNSSLSILHVASFQGNIGDNANHNGTRRKLREILHRELRFTESEIRKYYLNYEKDDALAFDEDFVAEANAHDMVMIGGGNFFELWVEDSVTGTTVDMPIEVYDRIESPVIFYGLGCDPHKGVPEENKQKFRRFVEYLLSDENCLVSVRNDGSKENIKVHFDETLAERFSVVPDGGFFLEVSDSSHPELPNDKGVIGINVATDMVDTRFPADGSNYITYGEFVAEFGNLLNDLLRSLPNYDLVFFPHIHSDIRAIADVLEEVETFLRRSRLTVAPLLHGFGSAEYIFDMYKSCDLTMGMRFHANVPSIGLKTPSIGLSSYPKIADLYDELGMPDRAVSINSRGFHHELEDLIFETMGNQTEIVDRYECITDSLEQDVEKFHSDIDDLLSSRGL